MDRGEQTFDIVRKLTNAMNRSSKELRKAVQETLDWLCTSPEYRNYIDATVPDDFSLLPNEIIHDVVDSYGVEGSTTLPKLLPELVKIEGSWGEFGRELSACTTQDIYGLNVIFHLKAYDCAAGSSRERKIPFKEARNRFICSSFINGDFDLEQLTAVAPKLYSDIDFYAVPDTHCKALDLMGTRFTRITWRGGKSNKPAKPELINFLRRQLRSNYLRKLDVNVKFEKRVLDKELLVFVTRPWFEQLDMGNGLHEITFEIIESAHKAWAERKVFKLKKRVIGAYFSKETLGKMEEYFNMKFQVQNEGSSHTRNIPHREESNAKISLTVSKVRANLLWMFEHRDDHYWVRIEICDL